MPRGDLRTGLALPAPELHDHPRPSACRWIAANPVIRYDEGGYTFLGTITVATEII
ncbi:hypothetical protein [Herbidospora cretacea]|uniref:hypothetical protein n=1 Tax=Herbidospora cretacea TaxID=28444 RepID=UPI000AD19EE2|nr:hypothetical protein [Herbidospora cretacea]